MTTCDHCGNTWRNRVEVPKQCPACSRLTKPGAGTFAEKRHSSYLGGGANPAIAEYISRGMAIADTGIKLPDGRITQGTNGGNGYRYVALRHNAKTYNVTLGRLVCWLVNGPPPTPRSVADHINGDKADDRPENLRWATASENAMNISNETKTERRARLRAYQKERSRRADAYDALVDTLTKWHKSPHLGGSFGTIHVEVDIALNDSTFALLASLNTALSVKGD